MTVSFETGSCLCTLKQLLLWLSVVCKVHGTRMCTKWHAKRVKIARFTGITSFDQYFLKTEI